VTCPVGYDIICSNQINYTYDAVGNRIARSQYCYCQAPGGRYANNAPDSLKSLSDLNAKGIVALYPNPTSNSVTVEFATVVENATIRVSNSVGQTVATVRVSGKTAVVDLKEEPAGIYLLTLIEGDTQQTRRIVKAD
jgi:hypothetical protein